ncbi:MAG TPA: TRAM domain-containing protein, partial [Cyclobacteriaceae bacterium]|nr:TRAM domain-containing protein [Cyclobacteriaceae bacterium]
LGHECGVSSDFIAGFCMETDEEHRETLSLMEAVKFDFSFMFVYSERPGTPAAKNFGDNIPAEVKKARLQEIIDLQNRHSYERNLTDIGRIHRVLVEGFSKRSEEYLQGRNSANKVVVFPKGKIQKGSYVNVLVGGCTSATLTGEAVD